MRYGVIVKVPTWSFTDVDVVGDRGNLASAAGEVFLDPQATGGTAADSPRRLGRALGQPALELFVLAPVFRLGEVLVLDGDDRDQFGRKPSKWTVGVEEFTDAEAACRRASEVVAEP